MALTNNQKLYIGCFAVIAIFCVGTLAFVNGGFGGSDDAGGESADKYGYEAWTGDILTIITGDPDYELPARPNPCSSRARPPSEQSSSVTSSDTTPLSASP